MLNKMCSPLNYSYIFQFPENVDIKIKNLEKSFSIYGDITNIPSIIPRFTENTMSEWYDNPNFPPYILSKIKEELINTLQQKIKEMVSIINRDRSSQHKELIYYNKYPVLVWDSNIFTFSTAPYGILVTPNNIYAHCIKINNYNSSDYSVYYNLSRYQKRVLLYIFREKKYNWELHIGKGVYSVQVEETIKFILNLPEIVKEMGFNNSVEFKSYLNTYSLVFLTNTQRDTLIKNVKDSDAELSDSPTGYPYQCLEDRVTNPYILDWSVRKEWEKIIL